MKSIISKHISLSRLLLCIVLLTLFTSIANAITVTVTACPTSIPADGNAVTELKAVVMNGSVPVVNETVNWSKEIPDSLGIVLDTTSTTNSSGVAKSRMRAPINTGSTTVIATVGSDTGSVVVNFVGPVNGIEFDTLRQNYYLPADGLSTVAISATVIDTNGDPVADGTRIDCSITSGSVTSPVYTYGGKAVAKVTSASAPGEAVLTFSSGSVTADILISYASTTFSGVAIIPEKKSIPSDGSTQTIISALVIDENGASPADGMVVSFSTDAGVVTASSPILAGQASASLTSSNQPAKATVSASYSSITNNTLVSFASDVQSIRIDSRRSSIPIGIDNATEVIAIVTDIDGNPVPDGTLVEFTTDHGTIDARGVCEDGIANATLFACSDPGVAIITATCGTVTGNGVVLFSGNPANIDITPTLLSIPANGISCCRVLVNVTDSEGFPVPDGTILSVSASSGIVPTKISTYVGKAEFPLVSTNTPGEIQVTVTNGTVNGIATVVCAGSPTSINSHAYPTVLPADGNAMATILVTVTDSNGRSVADGTVVTFTANNGTVTSTTTTLGGIATAHFVSSSSQSVATVTASCGSIQTQTTVTCQ
jgi:adhesin/invasin